MKRAITWVWTDLFESSAMILIHKSHLHLGKLITPLGFNHCFEEIRIIILIVEKMGFPGGSDGKESASSCRRPRFDPWIRKIPWRREWLPTPVFLPEEFQGQKSLAGYRLWDCKGSDMTEPLTLLSWYFCLIFLRSHQHTVFTAAIPFSIPTNNVQSSVSLHPH